MSRRHSPPAAAAAAAAPAKSGGAVGPRSSRKRKPAVDDDADGDGDTIPEPAAASAAAAPAGRVRRQAKRARAQDSFDGGYGEIGEQGMSPELQEELASREFWSQWHTDLLLAWLFDYKVVPHIVGDETRDDAISRLVVGRAALAQPRQGKELEVLQANWLKVNGGGDPPGRYVTPAASSAAAAAQAARDEAVPMVIDGPASPAAAPPPPPPVWQRRAPPAPAAAAAAAPPRTKQQPAAPVEYDQEYDEEYDEHGADDEQCIMCCTPKPNGAGKTWMCSKPSCEMRGDKDGMAVNALLMQSRVIAAASSASSSSAQSGTTAPALRGNDKHFHAQLAAFPDSPSFIVAKPDAARAKDLVDSAFAEGRKALDASAYTRPSDHLVQLIQAGKLVSIGFALPCPIAATARGSEDAIASIELIGGSFVPRGVGDSAAPILATPADFARALVCTILPALSGQPGATAQWLALARTVLEFEKNEHWHAARTYLERVLTDRVGRGIPFAEVDPSTVLSVRSSVAPRMGAYAGGLRFDQAARADGPGLCKDFNYTASGCSRGPTCPYRHICPNRECGGASHSSITCPRGGGRPMQPRSGSFGRGGGRGGFDRRSPRTNSDGASLRSAPTASSVAGKQ